MDLSNIKNFSMSDKDYKKWGSEVIFPLTSELQNKKPRDLVSAMDESSSASASTSASSESYSSSQSSSSTIIDKNTVEEIVHTRLNQSLSNLQPPITPGQQPDAAEITSTIIKSVLPEVISTVVSAVTEVLNKFVVQLEKTHSSKNEMVMQAHIRSLTYRNDELEQYSRRESVRMFGVAEDPNETSETTEKKAIQVFTDLGANVSPNDISACHRVGKPKDGKRAIIVRFCSRKSRQLVMAKKSNLKGKSGYEKVFINDDLTPLRQKLLGYVKNLPNIESAWTTGGSIIARKRSPPGLPAEKMPKPVRISSPDDLFLVGVDKVDYEKLGLASIAFGESCQC